MIKRVMLLLMLMLVTVSITFGNDPKDQYSIDKFDEIYREIHHNLDFNRTVKFQFNNGGDSIILYNRTEGVAVFIDRRESAETIVTFYGKCKNIYNFDQIAWSFAQGTDAIGPTTMLYKLSI